MDSRIMRRGTTSPYKSAATSSVKRCYCYLR